MNHDDDLQEFFAALREQDQQQTPPPFEGLPLRTHTVRRRKRWPLAAAAAAAVLLFALWPAADLPEIDSTSSSVVVSLEAVETTQTKTLLDAPASIDSWESPSASLIADF